MISLATRGYLYPRYVIQVPMGEGPKIVGAVELLPGIIGGISAKVAGPGITGSIAPGPSISGADSPISTGPGAPSISGSDKPKIG